MKWHSQGSKLSDFSLISDLFPAPRTILEISVNLERNIFREGGGVKGLNKMKKVISVIQILLNMQFLFFYCPKTPELPGALPPGPPPRKPHWGSAHFSDLFRKTHFDPCIAHVQYCATREMLLHFKV